MDHCTDPCPLCDAETATDGPPPDDKDRARWITETGDCIICPHCEGEGTVSWEENWLEGGSNRWERHSEECDRCHNGEFYIEDRCETCGRLEMQKGKGSVKIAESDRLFDKGVSGDFPPSASSHAGK